MPRNVPNRDNPDSRRVGCTLRTIRTLRGVRLSALATQVGVSHTLLSRIEAGQRRLSPELLVHVADALDVDPLSIMTVPDLEAAS